MQSHDPKLREIWQKANPPVVFHRGKSNPLLVRLPWAADNFEWLRDDKRHKPKSNRKYHCWEVPVAWYDWIAKRLVKRFGAAYLVQLHKEMQKCASACWNAAGLHCECSCMGANHGTGHPGGRWHEVSDTFAFEWGPSKYACRLLRPPPA